MPSRQCRDRSKGTCTQIEGGVERLPSVPTILERRLLNRGADLLNVVVATTSDATTVVMVGWSVWSGKREVPRASVGESLRSVRTRRRSVNGREEPRRERASFPSRPAGTRRLILEGVVGCTGRATSGDISRKAIDPIVVHNLP